MNSIDERDSESFKSSVSSPGMPKTCFTPSASRHSTKTSEALRDAIRGLYRGTETLLPILGWHPEMRRFAVLTALVICSAMPVAASASTIFVAKGRGFGHGIGMSQYGAQGFAQHGWDYRRILARYYKGTTIGSAQTKTIRVLLSS